MADSKKYNGSTWQHSLRKLTTATDTFTTLPVDIYDDGNNATVGLKGNTTQNGTPTPQNPVVPQGTGERTRNLITPPLAQTVERNGITIITDGNGRYFVSGKATAEVEIMFDVPVFHIPRSVGNQGGGTFSLFNNATYNNADVKLSFYFNDTFIDNWGLTIINRTSTTYTGMQDKDVNKLSIKVLDNVSVNFNLMPMITDDGILPANYEPYGYKIPISSADQTNNIYLGEVPTVRRVRKLVMTGSESFYKNSSQSSEYLYYTQRTVILPSSKSRPPVLCNELPVKDSAPQTAIGINADNQFSVVYLNFGADVMNAQPSGNTVAGLKEYLAAQYAAGTPVTVWYVLATEETGIVNEPLMKIGNYADTVSGITVPTITGKDTFDVDTTLKPSEVSLSYTGWHDATVEEWDGSDWQ